MACSMWLFRLAFRNYVALAPFVVWQSPWFASPLCDLWWCRCHDCLDDLVLLCWISLIGLSLMLCFCVLSRLSSCGRVHLCVGVLFVVFVLVFVFVWAPPRSLFSCFCSSSCGRGVKWMNGWVGCLNQFLCCLRVALLEGGASQGWRCLREALLEGGAARGWPRLFTWIDDPRNICDHC